MSAQRKPPRKISSGESLLIQREPNKLFGFPNKLPLGNVAVYVNNQNSDLIVIVEVSHYVRGSVLRQTSDGVSVTSVGRSAEVTVECVSQIDVGVIHTGYALRIIRIYEHYDGVLAVNLAVTVFLARLGLLGQSAGVLGLVRSILIQLTLQQSDIAGSYIVIRYEVVVSSLNRNVSIIQIAGVGDQSAAD